MITPATGLYVITAEHHANPEALSQAVNAALRGGAKMVQYRAKSTTQRQEEARLLLVQCWLFNVPLIINDDVELALAVGADGVHLGQDDGTLAEARHQLGKKAIIGVSCYDSMDRALEAQEQGADYVAFGRFFPSTSKPHAPCAQLETLRLAKERIHLPIVAIGGVTPHNGKTLLDAGAGLLAVIDGVFGARDPEQAAAEFGPLFSGTI